MVIGMCEVCNGKEAKYKCPVCTIKFCCVTCFKTHKGSDQCVKPVVHEEPIEKKEIEYEFETEDTVMPEKLKLLETDKNIKSNLENSYLRQLMTEINFSDNPNRKLEEAMQVPEFVEFVTHCLRVVENQNRYESSYNS